jgi:hypothetical protein
MSQVLRVTVELLYELLNVSSSFTAWIRQNESRHLANLTIPEVARALRALSSAYVERRGAIGARRVLDGAGKRAAFALYYAPIHYLAVAQVLEAIGGAMTHLPVLDLGCGTGAVGAAVAVSTGATSITGMDTHPWALDEARQTYAAFGLDATLHRATLSRLRLPRRPVTIAAGYVVNELDDEDRVRLLDTLLAAARTGSRIFVIEPLARGVTPWWPGWIDSLAPLGGRHDERKLTIDPPPIVQRLGEAAGLTPTAVNVRILMVGLDAGRLEA